VVRGRHRPRAGRPDRGPARAGRPGRRGGPAPRRGRSPRGRPEPVPRGRRRGGRGRERDFMSGEVDADRSSVSEGPASYRRIASRALPALVVLAAEPVYLLIDTAVVGHLGAVPLGGLALGGTLMGLAPFIGAVLAYGTTARAARRFGAGDRAGAVAEGVQGTWIALAAGLVMIVLVECFAGTLTAVMGDSPEVAAAAARWLRVAILGAPFRLVAGAGQGWMRAVQDTKRPMWFVSFSFLVSAVLAPVLVYPAGLGLVGSAWANVIARAL